MNAISNLPIEGRVERFGSHTLILGDCRKWLGGLSVDAIVTDPPYGLGDRMQGGTWGAADKYADLRRWDVPPTPDDLELLRRAAPAVVMWGANYFDAPAARCWLVWDKINAVRTMADVELAWTNLDRPAKRWRGPVGTHESGHPTEKPLPLMRWCVDQLGFNGRRIILDPYMGSGTTGVACHKAGHDFIGIEAQPKYFDIACDRIREAMRQRDLFVAEANDPVTGSMEGLI